MRKSLASIAIVLAFAAAPAFAQETAATPAAPTVEAPPPVTASAPAPDAPSPSEDKPPPAAATDTAPAPAATGPASASEGQPQATAAPEATAPVQAPAAALAAGAVAPPPAGKGQVVFYRPSRLGGMALSFSVHEGEKGIGKLGNGSYFIQVSDPGSHTFTIQSEVTDSLTLEVDAGETYYVEQTIGMGIMMGRPHLSPTDGTKFAKSKVKLSTKTATDIKPKTL